MNPKNCCIVSCGVGGGFSSGIERLERSLNYVGWAGHTILRKTYPEDSPSHEENPYAFKIFQIRLAIEKGFTHILWLDSSVYAVNNPARVFDIIDRDGVFVFKTGYNLAQTATDKLLEHIHLSRDDAEKFPEYAGGCIGLNLNNDLAAGVFSTWCNFMARGLFKNSRARDEKDSTDERFLHARQDQSALTAALAMYKYNGAEREEIAYFNGANDKEKVIFLIQGVS